jgi:flagellar basal body-associated protein FliL
MPEVPANLASANVPQSVAKRPAGKRKWLVSIVGVLAVAALIFLWPRPQGPSSATSGGTTETTLPLETFIVNLNGAGQRGYLRVGITLGLSQPRKKEDVPIALVRDAILSELASAQPDQLLAPGGKQNLKAEIIKALQESAPDLGVDNVYFTEFLVQM